MKFRQTPTLGRLRQGFTLVEIMVVVVILALLIALGVPAYRHYQRKAEITQFVNSLRIFTQSYQTFAMKYGDFPNSAAAGVLPNDGINYMGSKPGDPPNTGEIRDTDWSASWMGGQWKWDGGNSRPNIAGSTWGRVHGVISIVGASVDDSMMTQIDALLDDGDLTHGNFQKTNTSPLTYTYLVQQ